MRIYSLALKGTRQGSGTLTDTRQDRGLVRVARSAEKTKCRWQFLFLSQPFKLFLSVSRRRYSQTYKFDFEFLCSEVTIGHFSKDYRVKLTFFPNTPPGVTIKGALIVTLWPVRFVMRLISGIPFTIIPKEAIKIVESEIRL